MSYLELGLKHFSLLNRNENFHIVVQQPFFKIYVFIRSFSIYLTNLGIIIACNHLFSVVTIMKIFSNHKNSVYYFNLFYIIILNTILCVYCIYTYKIHY